MSTYVFLLHHICMSFYNKSELVFFPLGHIGCCTTWNSYDTIHFIRIVSFCLWRTREKLISLRIILQPTTLDPPLLVVLNNKSPRSQSQKLYFLVSWEIFVTRLSNMVTIEFNKFHYLKYKRQKLVSSFFLLYLFNRKSQHNIKTERSSS